MRKPKEPPHIIAAKNRLSIARVAKFKAMPADRAIWLEQMDECAASLGIENVYRPPVQRG